MAGRVTDRVTDRRQSNRQQEWQTEPQQTKQLRANRVTEQQTADRVTDRGPCCRCQPMKTKMMRYCCFSAEFGLSHSTHQCVTLIMRQREKRTVWACYFLPAKTHFVLSCSVSLTHAFEFFSSSLPYFHYVHSLLLSGSGRWEARWQSSTYTAFEAELQSICLSGQEVSDCCQSFLSRQSATSPLMEAEKPTNTEPISFWMLQ